MLPAVAEVVEVLEPSGQITQSRLGLVLDLQVVPVRIRHAVAHAVGGELVQMAVRPTERGLEQIVQLPQRGVRGNVDHADDGRLDVSHGDPETGGPHARTVRRFTAPRPAATGLVGAVVARNPTISEE